MVLYYTHNPILKGLSHVHVLRSFNVLRAIHTVYQTDVNNKCYIIVSLTTYAPVYNGKSGKWL